MANCLNKYVRIAARTYNKLRTAGTNYLITTSNTNKNNRNSFLFFAVFSLVNLSTAKTVHPCKVFDNIVIQMQLDLLQAPSIYSVNENIMLSIIEVINESVECSQPYLSVPLSPCDPGCCIWSRQPLLYYAAITGLISQLGRQVPAAHNKENQKEGETVSSTEKIQNFYV